MPVELADREAKTGEKNYLVKNYIVNTTDGALFALAMGMVPLNTVLVYFISDFVPQKWLIGLLTCLNILLMFSPQILISRKLERLRRYKPYMLSMALILRILWLLLGLDVILFAKSRPVLFTALFYLIYSLIGLISAFTGITWLNFIVKIIPSEFRGRFFGIRSTIAGVFESTGSLVMGVILKKFEYPTNYGVLFFIVFFLTLLSLAILSFSEEHETVREAAEIKDESYFSQVFQVLRNDTNFTYYLITVALIGGLGKMAFAFQVIFAKERLGIVGQQVSYATFILLASQTVGYLIWGILGDKYGFKFTLEISALIFIPSIIFTFMMSNTLVFYTSMCLFGLAQSARNVNENNLAINLCRTENKQPLYIGLRNLLMGPFFAFNPVLAGVIYDFLGYNALFIISTLFLVAGLVLLRWRVKEYM